MTNQVNSSQFSHYSESAEKMHSINHFFDNFVKFNVIKNVICLMATPAHLSSYSPDSLAEYLVKLAVSIILSVIMSYRDLYENRASQKKSRLCFLAAAFFIINELNLVLSSQYNFFSILMTITAVSAISKYSELDKLSRLKGYPLFSEKLDNPQYTAVSAASNIPPAIMNRINVPAGNTPCSAPPPAFSPLTVKSHVSVKLDDIKMPELSDMRAEIPPEKLYAEIIPDARDIPAEARMLGNAAIEYSAEKLSEITVSPIEYKKPENKINLSKERNI